MAERFKTRDDPAGTLLTGVSMGGFGTLKIGLRRPGRFGALAALEPAIEPGFTRAAATRAATATLRSLRSQRVSWASVAPAHRRASSSGPWRSSFDRRGCRPMCGGNRAP